MYSIRKFFSLPLSFTIPAATRKVLRPFHHLGLYLMDRVRGTEISDREFLRALDDRFLSFEALISHLKRRNKPLFFFEGDNFDGILTPLSEIDQKSKSRIVERAEQICEHHFDLLGSGPTYLGEDIDWHLDFIAGFRWKLDYFKFIRPAPYPGGYDIKVPRELSRCQHFIWLGQAFQLTRDERYAKEFQAQLLHWVEENPPKYGVNWSSTMDVAIRTVNWIWGSYLFNQSPSLSDGFYRTFVKSLLAHGRFIIDNLEIYSSPYGKFTANHYLANIVALVYLGILYPEFKESKKWRELGIQELEREMFRQVYPDGFDFESSTGYHRLVLEMFLSAVILARHNGISFSKPFMQRLEKMLEVILHLTRSDGTLPQLGDHDNGRLHRINVWNDPQEEWRDSRYLLAMGAVLFQRRDFGAAVGDQWGEALWLLGEEAIAFKKALASGSTPAPQPGSTSFRDAGIYVMRGKNTCLIVDAGGNGQHGVGGHAHNDLLSFELFAHGQPWIVDPGTYVYTSQYNDRRMFQSTAHHNTICVDQEEINRFESGKLFRFRDDAQIKVHQWTVKEALTFLDVEHHGYGRLKDPIIHRRQIVLARDSGHILIQDHLLGHASHLFEANFHFDSTELHVQHIDPLTLHLVHPQGSSLAVHPLQRENLEISLSEGWASKSYGLREPAQVLTHRQRSPAPCKFITLLYCLVSAEPVDQDMLDDMGKELLLTMEETTQNMLDRRGQP